ncbi:hypothetical protein [Aphanizomenon flos-aquae]|uniref:hypothetical protein n=1 Tax=Aphanizomenon flos-aquae TaxID=1176 RepID=UPI0004B90EFC|nr:hypothetical protein [Aphanizomenon flos-aquae]
MLHTLFSDVPVEQQETVVGGDNRCSCSTTSLTEEQAKEFLESLKTLIIEIVPIFP